jgi:hypothetical protein
MKIQKHIYIVTNGPLRIFQVWVVLGKVYADHPASQDVGGTTFTNTA